MKLNVYEADPSANASIAPAATVKSSYEDTVHGALCDIFFTPGINAKSIHRQVYVQAEVTVDGATYYSEVERYSVLEYCHEMIADEDTDADKDAKFQAVINYGAAIQSLLADDGKFEGKLATEYKYVTINGGTLDGKYNTGVYLAGTKLNPYGEGVGAWSDGNTAVLNGGEYIVTANATLNVANAKDLATESFENATSGNLPSNISFATTLPSVPNFSKYPTSGYVVGNFTEGYNTINGNTTKSLFTSNKYKETTAAIKISESIAAEKNANIVEFETDICLDWGSSSSAVEFVNILLTDASGNVAFNFTLKNSTATNVAINHRNSAGGAKGQIGQTLPTGDVQAGKWFNLRITYQYVSETEVIVKAYINGTALSGTATSPFNEANALSVSEISNVYVCSNARADQTISNYLAIDNVILRKIAE